MPTLGNCCPFYEIVKLWVNDFKQGRANIEDTRRPGTPKSTIKPENIDKVHDVVLADRRVEVRELTEAVVISI